MSGFYDATFSITGSDPESGETGVAIATKRLAVGNRCIGAKSGVGAVASQAATNPHIPDQALNLLARGVSPEECMEVLRRQDLDFENRQINIVNFKGEAASFTGKKCEEHAASISGESFAAAGNMLLNPEVVKAMAFSFQNSTGPLGKRLLGAISAGEKAGGDKRGKQSAAILVSKIGSCPFIDLRVDDSKDPVSDLTDLLDSWYLHLETRKDFSDLYFRSLTLGMVGQDVRDVSSLLCRLGYFRGPVEELYTDNLAGAVKNFQSDNGLSPSGEADEDTVQLLVSKGGRSLDSR